MRKILNYNSHDEIKHSEVSDILLTTEITVKSKIQFNINMFFYNPSIYNIFQKDQAILFMKCCL